ncbi:MAG: permease [Peptostreptococcaceae bacterium]|nr:permease [Peptostreptococcaceae bacterium]
MRIIYLYGLATLLLALSFHYSKEKTKMALKKAWKSFSKIFPALLGILILVGVLLAVFDADFITKIIGEESGWFGVFLSASVGAITLIPGFIAFPTASVSVRNVFNGGARTGHGFWLGQGS